MHNLSIVYMIFKSYSDYFHYNSREDLQYKDIQYLVEIKGSVPGFTLITNGVWTNKFWNKNELFETLTPEQKEVVIWNV